MTIAAQTLATPAALREARRVRRLLTSADIRVFLPAKGHEAGIFRAGEGGADLLGRATAQGVDVLIGEGALLPVRHTQAGRTYRAVPAKDRVRSPRTGREKRDAAWQAADLAFSGAAVRRASSVADSPIGWLARRRDPDGKPYLTRDEVAAAERLRSDFEQSQLAPGVTQDWRQFLTAGVQGGMRGSAQERAIGNGASAARDRLSDALASLGPSLSDVALRVCCFLEGIEAIESSMHWSRRSGKVVLKIALQQLAAFYEQVSIRNSAKIEAWSADAEDG